MKLRQVIYVCENCSSKFRAPAIIGGYGVLLLRSEGRGAAAFVDTFEDPVFDEIGALARRLPAFSRLSDRRRGELVQYLFGITVDPDDDGSPFGVAVPPRCPVCGSNRMAHWQTTEPPEFVEVDLPAVTHTRWSHLSNEEKLRELTAGANDFLSA